MVPYKECKQGQEPQEFDETKLAPKKFIEKECTQTKKEIPHKKLLPECRNVTKQNCVTNWETDSYGNQVRRSFQPTSDCQTDKTASADHLFGNCGRMLATFHPPVFVCSVCVKFKATELCKSAVAAR